MISDSLMTTEEASAFAHDYGFEFPILWDSSGDLAMRVEPTVTPEAFVPSDAWTDDYLLKPLIAGPVRIRVR